MTIDLMSGSNLAMNVVTNVASGIDGTSGSGLYSFPCPAVTPYSAIYFYQFSLGGLNPTWTTRFTIADASGKSVAPQYATQPSGQAIPWGTGRLTSAAVSNPSSSALLSSSAIVVASSTASVASLSPLSSSVAPLVVTSTASVVPSLAVASTTSRSMVTSVTPTSTVAAAATTAAVAKAALGERLALGTMAVVALGAALVL